MVDGVQAASLGDFPRREVMQTPDEVGPRSASPSPRQPIPSSKPVSPRLRVNSRLSATQRVTTSCILNRE